MKNELAETEKLFKKLIKSREEVFPKLYDKLHAPLMRGVYLIIDPKNKIVHVGNTPRGKNGIFQRLKNHLSGLSSFVYKYEPLKKDGSKLRGKYKFKYLVEKNPRKRVLLEAYAVGHLSPKHLGLG